MSLLNGLLAVAGIVSQASALVNQTRKPETPSSAPAFLDVLQQSVNTKAAKSEDARVLESCRKFIAYRDTTGNGKLNLAESGLAPKLFHHLDVDGDGLLCERELVALFSPTKNMVQT